MLRCSGPRFTSPNLVSRFLQNITFPARPKTSQSVQHFLAICLAKRPDKRPTVHNLVEHEWVTEKGKHALSEDHVHGAKVDVSEEEIRTAIFDVNGFYLVANIKFRMHSLLLQARLSLDGKNLETSINKALPGEMKILHSRNSSGLLRTKRKSAVNQDLLRTVIDHNAEAESDEEYDDVLEVGDGLDGLDTTEIVEKECAVTTLQKSIDPLQLNCGSSGAVFQDLSMQYGVDAAQGNLHL